MTPADIIRDALDERLAIVPAHPNPALVEHGRYVAVRFGLRLAPAEDVLAGADDEVLRACVPLTVPTLRPLDAAFAEHDRAIADRIEEALETADPFEAVRAVVAELRGEDSGRRWAREAGR